MTVAYTAESGLIFRALVRSLARCFGGRIEIRQIGARDEATRLGGADTLRSDDLLREFLIDVKPVNVKQARIQASL